jgi:hypothetical protein
LLITESRLSPDSVKAKRLPPACGRIEYPVTAGWLSLEANGPAPSQKHHLALLLKKADHQLAPFGDPRATFAGAVQRYLTLVRVNDVLATHRRVTRKPTR